MHASATERSVCLPYECLGCGWKAGATVRCSWNGEHTASFRQAVDTLKLIRCPRCGWRDEGSVRRLTTRSLLRAGGPAIPLVVGALVLVHLGIAAGTTGAACFFLGAAFLACFALGIAATQWAKARTLRATVTRRVQFNPDLRRLARIGRAESLL